MHNIIIYSLNDAIYHSIQVNLGVLEVNPSKTKDTGEILDHLAQYVPHTLEGPITIPCHGDGLTVDRIMRAKRNRSNHPDAVSRLECYEGVPQEFHKEMLILQVSFIDWYSI